MRRYLLDYPKALAGLRMTKQALEGARQFPRDEASAAWVLARAEDDDACRAVSRAVERVAKAVGEEIARRDREDASRAHTLLAFSQSGVVERV